ncbi:MAG: site-2 protease family protein [Candidatus Fimivivens sp.]
MGIFIKSDQKKPCITCDFWFFAVVAAAVYFGGDALCLLLAALIHEVGHWIALIATNNGVLQLRLRGCCAHIVPHYRRLPSLRQEVGILAAGPLVGILVALILKPFAPWFAEMSLLLSLFNLLPVRGLDGGSILRLIYAAAFNTENMQVPNTIGAMVALWALVAGAASIFANRPNIPLLGVAVFLILRQFVLGADAD